MKKILLLATVFLIVFSLFSTAFGGADLFGVRDVVQGNKGDFIPDELVIGYRDNANFDEVSNRVRNAFSLVLKEKGYKANFEVVKIPKNKGLDQLISEIAKDKDVKYVEPNYIAYASTEPNDPYFHPYQWNFYDYGMLSNGYASNYGIQVVSAWNITKGKGVKIAIVDTGIAYEDYGTYKIAPDLAGTNFDSANAYDFINTDAHANDDEGHGTHVCGTIAQTTNNSYGCAGIAYEATMLPVKVLDASGSGSYTAVANGIRWAADKGARVINLSLGGKPSSTTLYDAVKYAYGKGAVIVCAAGNSGIPKLIYPAAYTECIAVGATRFDGARAKYSNYGSALDIVAPGGDSNVDQNKDGYGDGILQQTFASGDPTNFGFWFYTGTSMATPHVSAVAALVLSVNSGFTNEQVRTALTSTAKDLGAKGWDKYYGYGLVNALGAVSWKP